MNISEIVERASRKFNGDVKLCAELGIKHPSLSEMKKKRMFSPYVASRCAEIVGENPVAATLQAEADKDKERRDHWSRLLRRVATPVFAAVLLSGGAGQSESHQQVEKKHREYTLCEITWCA